MPLSEERKKNTIQKLLSIDWLRKRLSGNEIVELAKTIDQELSKREEEIKKIASDYMNATDYANFEDDLSKQSK